MKRHLAILAFALLLAGLAGCDQITELMADPRVAQRAADAKAIGSACRYGVRSIEDCYAMNDKVSKAGIFEGWKEMDQYMLDNKIDGIPFSGSKSASPVEEVISGAKTSGSSSESASDKTGTDDKSKAKAKSDH
jgi:hypothetical protein